MDTEKAAFVGLTPAQKEALIATDRMRNVDPKVVRCTVDGAVVTFDKEAAFTPGGPRQHVYGAVRFLDGAYTTFQMIRGGDAPSAQALDQLTAVVKSWKAH